MSWRSNERTLGQRLWRPLCFLILSLGCVAGATSLALASSAPSSAAPHPGQLFLERLAAAQETGALTAEQALLYRFAYGFAPEVLPEEWRPAEMAPLKCATPLLMQYAAMRSELSGETVGLIDSWLAAADDPTYTLHTYYSPGGHFQLSYYLEGTDAVPADDVDPADGLPDYIAKMASYCDYTWETEIDVLGFAPPPIGAGYYQISFEDMNYYGYTTVVSGALTRIVLHNDYLGFPSNDDPDGSQWGAAKVTIAHEFKHASQRAGSLWTEGGWVEVDATWMEDIVYDYVNDYYWYLRSGSPISDPEDSLDAGGTGSYEDCVWQHWMSETWDVEMIREFWVWRMTHTTQPVLDSYDQILRDHGSSVTLGWPTFASWNSACGTRAITSLGYGEAARYPTPPVVATYSAYPTSKRGSVAHLAANFVECVNLSGLHGAVRVNFLGQDGSLLRLTAVIRRTDGVGVIESIPLDALNDADATLAVPLEQIATLHFAISNGAISGVNQSWTLIVDLEIAPAAPVLALGTAEPTLTLVEGETGLTQLTLANGGDPGSLLTYAVTPMASLPTVPTGFKASRTPAQPASAIASGVTVLTPAGGELWPIGGVGGITWSTTGSIDAVRIDVSRDGGLTWQAATDSTGNSGAFSWTVSAPASPACLVRVSSLDGGTQGVSPAPFTVYAPVDWLTVSPLAGVLAAGECDTLGLLCDAGSLAAGDYTAVLVIHHDAEGTPTIVPVTLTVTSSTTGVASGPAPLFLITGNYPNPFNPITSLSFVLPAPGPATVDVLDARGRRLRVLVRGVLPAGTTSVIWDGRDDAGRQLPSGVYLARLVAGGRTATHKMVLTK